MQKKKVSKETNFCGRCLFADDTDDPEDDSLAGVFSLLLSRQPAFFVIFAEPSLGRHVVCWAGSVVWAALMS
jgi:hypothetical protein